MFSNTIGSDTSSYAFDINDAGDVVGYSDGARLLCDRRNAFIWRNGELIPLEPFCTGSEAHAINSAGQVLGNVVTGLCGADAEVLPVIWHNGERTLLCTAGQIGGSFMDINDLGTALFTVSRRVNDRHVHYLYESGTGIYTEGPLLYEAFAVNSSHRVVGSVFVEPNSLHGAIWENGMVIDIGTFGGRLTFAFGINEQGHVVGYSDVTGDVPHAFLWTGSDLLDLGAGYARDINESMDIVGMTGDLCGQEVAQSAALWKGGRVFHLNCQIPPGTGWSLREPMAINNKGQIVGQGRYNGNERAFLLNPVKP